MNMWRAKRNTCPMCRDLLPPIRRSGGARLADILQDCLKRRRLEYLHANVEYWKFHGSAKGEKAWQMFTKSQMKEFCSNEAVYEMHGTPWLRDVVLPYIEYRKTHKGFLSRILR